ncbi:MAG: dockerin type I repeat-containing protein, partial [Bacteroidaceae bacterium]
LTNSGKNSFEMSATNLCNLKDVTFNGTVQMIITNNNNTVIAAFGNKVNINNLNTYGYLARTYDFSGTLPDDLPNGEYRLQLGAQQSGYSNWAPVKKYVIDGGYITKLGIDAYTTFWLTESGISLDDPFSRGDVDCNGKINSADIIAVFNFIIDPSITNIDKKRADANGDGTVNTADITTIYNIIIGKE